MSNLLPVSDILTIRRAFADTFQTYPFSVKWVSANHYEVQMFPHFTQAKDQRYYTYLMIDGKAVRQN